MAQRRSAKRQSIASSLFAVIFLFRAMAYIAVGAWIWALFFLLVAAGFAYSAYQAYLKHQEVKAEWQAQGLDVPADDDAYFKKCAECGKFTRDADVCRHCGRSFELPPTKASGPAA